MFRVSSGGDFFAICSEWTIQGLALKRDNRYTLNHRNRSEVVSAHECRDLLKDADEARDLPRRCALEIHEGINRGVQQDLLAL